jgi:SpoVK/Ycf46/Vps4 family AAA+-type ATPase
MGPVREVAVRSSGDLQRIDALSMPPISLAHFSEAFEAVMPSVSTKDLHRYVQWNNEFGSFRRMV